MKKNKLKKLKIFYRFRKNRRFFQKKAMIINYITIIGFVIALCIFYFLSTYKNKPKNTEFVGQVFLDSYKEMQNSFKDMYYIEQSAKYSIYNATYALAKKGFYFKDPCLTNEMGYVMWKNIFLDLQTQKDIEVSCYPSEDDIKVSYASFLNEELNKYFERYTPTLIPKDNYDLSYNEKENNLEITGIATQKIRIPPNPMQYKEKIWPTLTEEEQKCLSEERKVPILAGGNQVGCIKCPEKAKCEDYLKETYCNIDPCSLGCTWIKKCKEITNIYAITPSFKTEINYNFINKFKEYINKTIAIENNITHCLEEGSGKPYDIDLITCSNVNELKKQIKGIENFEIIPLPGTKDHTLLFDIEDLSFKSPYSDEKLVIKYGLRFLDKFPPPATEISGVEIRTSQGKSTTYFTWYKNHASDVESYEIYYTKIEDKLGGGEIPEKPPTDIEKMKKIETPLETEEEGSEIFWRIDYENTGLEKGQKYYFYIRAKDNAGNFVKEIDTEPIKITI